MDGTAHVMGSGHQASDLPLHMYPGFKRRAKYISKNRPTNGKHDSVPLGGFHSARHAGGHIPYTCNLGNMDNDLTIPARKSMLLRKAQGLGSPTGQHSGGTKIHNQSGAGVLFCSQPVHSHQEGRHGKEIIRTIKTSNSRGWWAWNPKPNP